MAASRWAPLAWALYDLANTIFSLNVVSLYFSVWVVNVMGRSDSTYALANSASMAIVFVLAPFAGALTDRAGRRMPFLVVSTIGCVALTALLGRNGLVASLVAFAGANVFYQMGLQFYDALLPTVSDPSNRGRVGGLGIGLGYLGSLIGLLTGRALLAGVDGLGRDAASERYATLFRVSAALFLLFALPCFLLVRERGVLHREAPGPAVRAAAARVRETLRSTRSHPGLVRFLVGRALYTDAANTVIAFMGIYVTNAVGFTSNEASMVLLVAIVCAAIGGFAWGRAVDRLGPKRTLVVVLGIWMVVFAWTAAVGWWRLPRATFWPVPALAGIALGGTWTADRPFLLRLAPSDRVGEFYGLYGMVGRFAAVTGPLIWVFVSETLGLGRPAAVAALLIFVVAAWIILRPVSDRPRSSASTPRVDALGGPS